MTCEDCRASLALYVRRDLPEPEEREIARHLETCATCRRELAEEERFARGRIARAFSRPLLAAGTIAAATAAAIALLWVLAHRPAEEMEANVTAWAVSHYALLDQTHPFRGDSSAVRAWFREHHGADIIPPGDADYSALRGCKMTEMEGQPAPLLRFESADTSGVFILPATYAGAIAPGSRSVIHRRGYRLVLWTEERSAYLRITRDRLSF